MSLSASTRDLGVTACLSALCGVVLAACGSPGTSTPSSAGATPTGASTSSAAATASGSSTLPTCPTGAAVSAAAGFTYPAPSVQSSAGFLTCTYADPTTGANMVIVATSEPGVAASTIQSVTQSQAAAQHVTASPVAGLGNAAFTFTLPDAATNSLHVATTILEVLQGSIAYDITAEATLDHVETVARLLLG